VAEKNLHFKGKGSMSKFKKCDNLFRAMLKKERPLKCEICGKSQEELRFPLSVFHILKKSTHPRLRYAQINVLLTCFAPYYWGKQCHNKYEDNRPPEIKQKIAEARGHKTYEDLENELRALHATMPKLDIKMQEIILKQECNPLNRTKKEEVR